MGSCHTVHIMDVLKDFPALACSYKGEEYEINKNFQSILRILDLRGAERSFPNVNSSIYFLNFYLFTSHFSSVCRNEKKCCLKRSVYFLIVFFCFPSFIFFLSLNTKFFFVYFQIKYFLNSTLSMCFRDP